MKKVSLIVCILLLLGLGIFQYLKKRVTISIIVPVYNAAQYLPRCLDSIMEQGGNFEVIVVNDGSTDNSLDIMRKYAEKYSNIHIVNQENKGVSAARNIGLNKAENKYITFVDADDWLEPNAFELVEKIIKKDNSDIVLIGFYDVYDREWVKQVKGAQYINEVPEESRYPDRNLDKLALFSPFYGKDAHSDLFYAGGGVRGRFYKKEFLARYNISFPENISCHEDDYFNVRAFLHNPLISVEKSPLYNYRNRITGLSKSTDVILCAPKSLYAVQKTAEYQKANRQTQLHITDNWLALFNLGLLNIYRYRNLEEAELLPAWNAYKDFLLYNREERKSARNFPKLQKFFMDRGLNLPL